MQNIDSKGTQRCANYEKHRQGLGNRLRAEHEKIKHFGKSSQSL